MAEPKKKSIWDQVDDYRDKYPTGGDTPPPATKTPPPATKTPPPATKTPPPATKTPPAKRKGFFQRFGESIIGDRGKQIDDAVTRSKTRPPRRKKKKKAAK